MEINLSGAEIDMIRESLRYGIRNMEEYASKGKYPPGYDWRAQSVGPLKNLLVKLSAAKKKESE